MTNQTYTPGPWEWVQYKSEWGGVWLFSGDVPVIDYDGCGSHDTLCSGPDRHLIASAPELLDALEDMLSGWRYIREVHGDLYGVSWDRAESAASAAIAKAKGEIND